MTEEERKGLIYGSLAADALSLGCHWVYDTEKIARERGVPSDLADPLARNFHPARGKGDWTHYGDQTFWLLESLVQSEGFNEAAFRQLWQKRMKTYDGYRDKASLTTLKTGEASSSDDLGGAARIAPLAYLLHDQAGKLSAAAAAQTAITHNHPFVRDTARFFSALLFENSGRMEQDLRRALEAEEWESPAFPPAAAAGIASADQETTQAIREFGPMCSAERALPGTIHLLVRYPDDLRAALMANTAAGGDSAARGLLAGMVLGRRLGYEAVPRRWRDGLNKKEELERALRALA